MKQVLQQADYFSVTMSTVPKRLYLLAGKLFQISVNRYHKLK